MTVRPHNAVVLITGSDEQRFGTGFVLCQDDAAIYIVTCMHVIEDIGAKDDIFIDYQYSAALIAYDNAEGFDVAVLKVSIFEYEAIEKHPTNPTDFPFLICGYSETGKQKKQQILKSRLERRGEIISKQYGKITSWDILIEEGHSLKPGYSGSPLIGTDEKIIGIVNLKQGDRKGQAISIEAVLKIWKDAPTDLYKSPIQYTTSASSKPLINFEQEIQAFYEVVHDRNEDLHVCLIHGESSFGKTRLLEEYERIAAVHGIISWKIDFKQPRSIEKYLSEIVNVWGSTHFPKYEDWLDQALNHQTPEAGTRWLEGLTRKFFNDLKNFTAAPRIVLLLDHYDHDRPSEDIKKWLTENFIPLCMQKLPLFLVIAGQEEIEINPNFKSNYRVFKAESVKADDYIRYAEQVNAPLDNNIIPILHSGLNGSPGKFVNFIQTLSQKIG